MWSQSRADAMVVLKEHIVSLRASNNDTIADALEHVLCRAPRTEEYAHFEVEGAGELEVGDIGNSRCGKARGVHFGASWGQWGYAGGVMDAEEVRRMVRHILSLIGDDRMVVEKRGR